VGRYEDEDRGKGVCAGYWLIFPVSWYRKNLSLAIGKKYISTLLTTTRIYETIAPSSREKAT
jgi:hypothetical protein